MLKSRLFLLLSMAAALTACDEMQGPPPKVANPDVTSLRLAEAAEKAADALDSMSKVEQLRGPQPTPDDFASAPPELQTPITISWAGPLDRIAPLLAKRAGYTLTSVGAPPPVPITVRLDLYNAPLVKAIADIGTQAGEKANVTVDTVQHVIEIRYAPSDANPTLPADTSGILNGPSTLPPPPDSDAPPVTHHHHSS